MAPIAYLNVLKTKREILSLQAERDNERKKPCVSSKKKKEGEGAERESKPKNNHSPTQQMHISLNTEMYRRCTYLQGKAAAFKSKQNAMCSTEEMQGVFLKL